MTDSTKPTSMRYRREVNVANNTLASILERYNGVLEQVLQRIDLLGEAIDILEQGQKNMDQKLTARVNDIDERMKVSPGGDIGAQMLEVLDDHSPVSDALGEISREAARDVVDNFDFEYHHVESAVRDALDNTDLSDFIDEEGLDVRKLDLYTLAEYLIDEQAFVRPLRAVDEHEDRLDKMGDQMCMVIGMLERIGIATEPSSHTELFGDKRSVHQTFGDLVAKMSEEMSADDRAAHLNLIRDTVAENVAKGVESEE